MPRFNAEKSKVNITVETCVCLFILFLIVVYILLAMFIVLKPRGPLTFGELIPREYFYWPVHLLISSSHVYLLAVIVTSVGTMGSLVFVYLAYFAFFVPQELNLDKRQYKSLPGLREVLNLVKVYRSFQILHANALHVFGLFLVAVNSMLMTTVLYVNFTLARHWNKYSLLIKAPLLMGSPAIIIFWAVVLDFGRIFSDGTESVLMSWKVYTWKTRGEAKEMRKFRKSCKPIKISYGIQFVVGRLSVLKFFKGVVRGTMRALLTTKQ